MEQASRALLAVAVVLALLSVILRVLPAPVGAGISAEPMASSADPLTTPSRASPSPEAAVAAIAGRNIFSTSRVAPRTRYAPPGLSAPAPSPGGARVRSAPSLRLFGTVVGPGGPAALIDADPAVSGAEIYRPGDVVGGRRIVSVSESTVVLEGSSGRTVLRLQTAGQPSR